MCARQNFLKLARELLIPSTLNLGVHLLMSKLLRETPEVHSAKKSTSVPKGIQIHPWTGSFRQHLMCSKPNTLILTPLQTTSRINMAAAWWHPCYWSPGKEKQIHLNLKPEWSQLYIMWPSRLPPFSHCGGTKHTPLSLCSLFIAETESTGCQQAEPV